MKTTFIISVLLFICSLVNAQVKQVPISEETLGGVICKYGMSIDLDKGDTLKYVYLGFKNAKYKSIIDVVSISFDLDKGDEAVLGFIKNLKSALGEMGNKSSITWDKNEYRITLYDFTEQMYLCEARSKGDGYILLNKKQVQSLIDWIELKVLKSE